MSPQLLRRAVQADQGIVLIEALIAILLFSLGVLALVGLQATMNKNVTEAKFRGEASFIASQLLGQMWVDQANLGKYSIADGDCAESTYENCKAWASLVTQSLPGGEADVTVNGSVVQITVSWQLPDQPVSEFQIDANIIN